MGVGKFGQIWAEVGKGGQVWMGQTDRAGMGDMELSGCGYACRSRGGCGWVHRLVTPRRDLTHPALQTHH